MMFFRQYYLGCLSHASYLIGDDRTGRAVVVDPQRDVDEYQLDAAKHGLTITKVVETHFHADFVSGHLELAARTGAAIVYGRAAAGRPEFPVELLGTGDTISLGDADGVVLEIRETPGHTPESICVVIHEHGVTDDPFGVLTGDTLFIGDVGRPDLLVSVGVSADTLGRQLYRSLHEQLLTLPDSTKVFPAHGAGSACGKHLSTETESTIGEQRQSNDALAPMTEDQFVLAVSQGQSVAPLYFAFAANRNREARGLIDDGDIAMLDVDEAVAFQRAGAVIIDARDDQSFAAGHLPGSINVGLGGRFAEFAGQVMAPGTPIVLVTPAGEEREARVRLSRIGFDSVIGALATPSTALTDRSGQLTQASRLTPDELAQRIRTDRDVVLLDVRNASEVEHGTIDGATNISLTELLPRLDELDPAAPTVVFCAGGYRSSIAASLLRARGFSDVSDLLGGYAAWSADASPIRPAS